MRPEMVTEAPAVVEPEREKRAVPPEMESMAPFQRRPALSKAWREEPSWVRRIQVRGSPDCFSAGKTRLSAPSVGV